MNIDTSSLTQNNEMANYLASSQTFRTNTGNTAFKSQFNSLSEVSETKTTQPSSEKSETKTEKADETKSKETSFKEEETKVSAKNEEKAEKTEQKQENTVKEETKEQQGQQNANQQNSQQHNQENQLLSEEIAQMLKINAASKLGDVNSIQNLTFTSEISKDVYTGKPALDYSTISMSDDDAQFFVNLVTKTDMSMQSIASEFQKSLDVSNVQNVHKTAKVSSALMEALSESMKTNKAFRIDFDKDVSVVMRVDKNGNLNANFIPGDKAVEAYLRNNISYLKQRFDEQDLPYNELTYSRHRNQEQNEKRNNKEKDNE